MPPVLELEDQIDESEMFTEEKKAAELTNANDTLQKENQELKLVNLNASL